MREFIRGERAKLSDLAAINHIWEVSVALDAPFYIVDFCCLGLDAHGEVVDDRYLISYNQPDAPQDAIRMNNASNNGAIFTVHLGRLPQEIRRVVFTATLHKPEMPGGLVGAALNFFGAGLDGPVGEGYLTLSTPAIDVGSFLFSGENFGEESTLILGELYWRDEWRFVAAGQAPKGELSDFLRTLTDGPTPAPLPSATPAAKPPVVAPPRPPRPVIPAPRPQAPVLLPTAPSAPIPVKATPVPVPTAAPVQPAAASISARPKATQSTAPVPAATLPIFPRELAPGEKLQDLIDDALPGSTVTLVRDEYPGPVIINKPLVLEGRDSALWARTGPVITVTAPDVELRNLDVEITVAHDDPGEQGVALRLENVAKRVQLENVRVRGRISGLGEEDGDWQLPALLDLGQFAPRALNELRFTLRVPTAVRLSSPVEGVSLSPAEVGAGQHLVTLQVRDVLPDSLIVGFVELRSEAIVRTIPLRGSAVTGVLPRLA